MGTIITKDRIVIPGQVIAEGMDYLPAKGTFREGESIIATVLGLLRIEGRLINVVPLRGPYLPKAGDVVIGTIEEIGFGGWQVDIGIAYPANLSMKEATKEFIERGADLARYYNFNDIIFATITNVIRLKAVDLSMNGQGLRKLPPGRLIDVDPTKIPRIIGKQGSMISMIKEKTKCQIVVGQNGKAWIKGETAEDELKADQAIRKIEAEGHNEGLTEHMEKFLE
ncbi:RNA-binding protein [archaeon]|nr:RNA-binding protein [archaeon]|tara:strand:+ start:108 stop:782 length:675 start_codon:yes stop_codon:yes gene_type:complete